MSADTGDGNCYRFNRDVDKAVAALRSAVGVFSAVCCLGVIAIMILYRKYRVFTQRLVLNLAIAAFVHSLSYPFTRVNYYTDLQVVDAYCNFGSLLNFYSSWAELLALLCIVVHLFVGAILRRRTDKFEPAFWVATYALPILWSWIPYIHQSYGTSGPWCGFRVLNEDCSNFAFGKILQFTLWYIPLYTLLLVTCIVSVLVFVKVQRDVHRWAGLYDPETEAYRKRIKTEIRPLLWFPVVYLVLNTFSFIDRVYNAARPNDPQVALTFLHVLTSPFRGAFIALVYALADRTTRRRLNWGEIKVAWRRTCCSRKRHSWAIEEYPSQIGPVEDSVVVKS